MASLSRAVVVAAVEHGIDLGRVLKEHGVTAVMLERADEYVPVAFHVRLWEESVRQSGRRDFGVLAAETVRPGLTGIVEWMLRNCERVDQAVDVWLRFAPLVCDRLSSEVVRTDGVVQLHWNLDLPLSSGHGAWAEFALARTVAMFREACVSKTPAPVEVWFRHARPPRVDAHDRHFQAPVRFGMPHHALVWRASWLDERLGGADRDVRRTLEVRAEAKLHRFTRTDEVALVKEIIRARLAEGMSPSAASIASRLGLSRRTLQRRLAARGASLRGLVDELRRELASTYRGLFDQAETANRLGFADAAALRRAQRRWRARGP